MTFRKALIFGLAGLIGALTGELASEPITWHTRTFASVVGQSALWSAMFTLGIGLALILAQNVYLKHRLLQLKQLIKGVPGMFIAGAIAGAIAQTVYSIGLISFAGRGTEGPLATGIRIFGWALA